MKQMIKKMTTLILVILLFSVVLSGCSRTIDNTAVIATINGEEASAGLANFFLRFTQAQYETYYAPMMGTTSEEMWVSSFDGGLTSFEDFAKSGLQENFENLFIMRQHAEEYGISLSEADRNVIDEVVTTFIGANTEANLTLISGTEEIIREYLELITISTRMNDAMRVGVDKNIPDSEALQKAMEFVFFPFSATDANGESVTMNDTEMEEMRTIARTYRDDVINSNFDMRAPSIVIDPNTEDTVDDGQFMVMVQEATFDLESTVVPTEVIEAAWNLSENEITDLIEVEGGIFVAKLTSELDREATDARIATIIDQRETEQFEAKLTEWRDASTITHNTRLWDRISFIRLGVMVEQFPATDTTDETNEPVVDETTDTGINDQLDIVDDAAGDQEVGN